MVEQSGGDDKPYDGKIRPGEVRNPLGAGAPAAQQTIKTKRELRNLTAKVLKEIIEDVLMADPQKLGDEVSQNPTVLKQWIAKAAEKGVNNGNLLPLIQLFERSVGTVKQQLEITNKPPEKTLEELEAEYNKIQKQLAAK